MGYVADAITSQTGTASSITPTLPAHRAGDLLLVCATNGSGATTLATATPGWAAIGTQGASGSNRAAWFWKAAASSSETAPTITGSSAAWAATALVVRGAHGTPIDANSRADYATSTTATTGATTVPTGRTATLVLQSWSSGGTQHIYSRPEDLIVLGADRTNIGHVVGYRNYRTDGALPTITARVSASSGGNAWTILIRDDGNGELGPDPVQGLEVINLGYAIGPASGTFQPLSTHLTTVDGITVDNTATMGTALSGIGDNSWGLYLSALSSGTAARWNGFVDVLASPINVTGKILSFSFLVDSFAVSFRMGTRGVWIVLMDASNNWAAYSVATQAVIAASSNPTGHFDIENVTPNASSGTLDLTAVNRVAYMWHHSTGGGAYAMAVKHLQLVPKTCSVTGGSVNSPVSPRLLHKALNGYGAWDRSTLVGSTQRTIATSGQFQIRQHLQLGDGTTPTVVDFASYSLETPPPYSSVTGQLLWEVLGGIDLSIKACAACVMRLRNCLMYAAVPSRLTVDAASSTSATYDFAGAYIENYTITGKTGVPITGATIKRCPEVDVKGGSLIDCTVQASLGTSTCKLDPGGSVAGTAFQADTAGQFAVRIPTAGTYTLDNATFTGFTTAINITATTGTVTLHLALGQSTPTYTTAGATVVIDQPTVSATASVTGAASGSRIRVYNVTADTPIYDAVATSWTLSYNDGNEFSDGDTYRVIVTRVSGTDADLPVVIDGLASSAGWAVDINQSADTVYETHAIDGSTLTGVAWTPSTVDIDLDGTDTSVLWREIYARWVWAFHQSGGEDLVGAAEAIDLANFRFNAAVVINVAGATPVRVGGDGYGRRADGGSLFGTGLLQIDNGVGALAVETGVSGLTPAESAQLAATATQTTLLAVKAKTDNLPATPASFDETIEGTYTAADVLRLQAAALAGKTTGQPNAPVFRAIDDSADRIAATVDSNGNRTSVTLTP